MTEIWKTSWRGLKVWSRVNILYFTKSEGQNNRLFTWIHCRFSFFFLNSCCCYLSDWVGRRAGRSEWRCCPCVSRAEPWLGFFLGRTSSLRPAWCRSANFWDLNWLLSVFPSQSIIAQKDNHLCTFWIIVFLKFGVSRPPHHQLNDVNVALCCEDNGFFSGQESVAGLVLQVESDSLVEVRCSHLDKHLLVHPHVEDSGSRDEEPAHHGWKVEGLVTLRDLTWDHYCTHFP